MPSQTLNYNRTTGDITCLCARTILCFYDCICIKLYKTIIKLTKIEKFRYFIPFYTFFSNNIILWWFLIFFIEAYNFLRKIFQISYQPFCHEKLIPNLEMLTSSAHCELLTVISLKKYECFMEFLLFSFFGIRDCCKIWFDSSQPIHDWWSFLTECIPDKYYLTCTSMGL